MSALPHVIVDVLAAEPFEGNPLAVVLEADGLSEDRLRQLAEWLPTEETAFVLQPSDPRADLQVRAFRGATEVRFAGLATLAACRAWLDHGGLPRTADTVVEQNSAGLTPIAVGDGQHLRFRAPELFDRGAPDGLTVEIVSEILGLEPGSVRASAWLDNGSGFLGLLVETAEQVTSMDVDLRELGHRCVGVIGPHPAGGPADVELRAFAPSMGVDEFTANASLTAAFASWLVPQGLVPAAFTISQGAALGHRALTTVSVEDGEIWVGGTVGSRAAGLLEV